MFQDTDAGVMPSQARMAAALKGRTAEQMEPPCQRPESKPANSIPQKIFCGSSKEAPIYCLYGFCDASFTAYAAVVYLVKEVDGVKCSSFVACKTRVTPLKTVTVPTLELLSAVLVARLISNSRAYIQ